jgi:hypothetical protein
MHIFRSLKSVLTVYLEEHQICADLLRIGFELNTFSIDFGTSPTRLLAPVLNPDA